MALTSIIAIYALFWALSLFFVLPFHARRAGDVDPDPVAGAVENAPVTLSAKRIIAQVSVVALALFGLYYVNYVNGWLTVADLPLPTPPPPTSR